jgi:hypothetical protein
MWNYQNKLVSLASNVSSNVKPFKYEGTGLQSIKQINWKPNEKIKFTMEGRYIKGWMVKCKIQINNKIHFMAEFYRQGFVDILNKFTFSSFIEDFYRNPGANGCLYKRSAKFFKPAIKYKVRKMIQTSFLDKAKFSVDQNEKCRRCHDWTCANSGQEFFSLQTGGSRLGKPKMTCPNNLVLYFNHSILYQSLSFNPLKFCIKKS